MSSQKKYLTPDMSVKVREQLNLSQAKAAAGAGISRAYLNQFEGSKRVLDDKQLGMLWDYYILQGWKPDAAQEKPVEQQINSQDHGLKIMDGFVITQGAYQDYPVDDLMGEYYDNANKIKELNLQEIKRGFFTNFEEEALRVSVDIFALMARQNEIIQILHGQTEEPLDASVVAGAIAGDTSAIKTAGQYIQVLVAATLKNRVLPVAA